MKQGINTAPKMLHLGKCSSIRLVYIEVKTAEEFEKNRAAD
jgi:hypothetical protein